MSGPGSRVAGWDLLRGLCALTVACYHLSYWLGIGHWPALGTYGVYLFFVLSGASLAYTYEPARLRGRRDVLGFLVVRWFRLAPLYLVLCVVFVLMLGARAGVPVDRLVLRFALNATFAFGLHDPATWALLVGGWSLGIEFVLYLAFPWLLRLAGHAAGRWAVLAALAMLQWWWIRSTLGALGWADGNVAYHQAPAFAGYFFAGCVIGAARRGSGPRLPLEAGVLAWALLAVLLAVFMPSQAGDELLGLAGIVLPCACVAVVWVSGLVDLRGLAVRFAAIAGDITYGTYLLHPMLLFGFAWFVLPLESLSAAGRALLFAAVLAGSCSLAWGSERWFEWPIRRRARRLLRPGAREPQSEAASISS